MLLIPFARWILAAIKFPFQLCWRPISSAMGKRRERRALDEVPLRDNPRGSVSRTALEMMRAMEKGIMIFSLISHALAGPSEFALPTSKMGCSNVQTLTIPSGHCSENGNGSYQCYSDKINTVDMFPGLPGCFQVSAEGKLSTFALLTLKSVKLVCSKQSLYFTADTEVEVHSNHRCSGSGQCYYGVEACSNFKSTDDIVDLPDDINEAVGDSGCIPAPGCASNGCFYCTQSCLFYKTVWKRKSNPVEVFRCSEWIEKFTVDVKFDNSDVVQTVELIRSEVTKVGNFTMWFDKGFDIVAPILSDKFIRMGKSTLISPASEQGMPVSGQIGDLQCPSEISAVEMRSGSCRKSQSRCSCSATGSAALCSCQNSKLTAVLETKKKLPITLANGILQMSSGSVELEAKERRPFTINIRVPNGGVIPYYREVSCTGSLLSFKGCYQCLTGAILKYTCHSSGGSVMTVADCGAFKIPISCGSDPTVIREVRVEPQSQEINVECKVMCQKGGFSFQMKAFLDYAGLPKFGTEGNVGEPSKGWSISMPQFGLIAIYSYYVLFLVLAALFGAFYILRRVLKKKEG